jgi:hypothetical protein
MAAVAMLRSHTGVEAGYSWSDVRIQILSGEECLHPEEDECRRIIEALARLPDVMILDVYGWT